MYDMYQVGDHAYIINSIKGIKKVVVRQICGKCSDVRLTKTGDGLRVPINRMFPTRVEARDALNSLRSC